MSVILVTRDPAKIHASILLSETTSVGVDFRVVYARPLRHVGTAVAIAVVLDL